MAIILGAYKNVTLGLRCLRLIFSHFCKVVNFEVGVTVI